MFLNISLRSKNSNIKIWRLTIKKKYWKL